MVPCDKPGLHSLLFCLAAFGSARPDGVTKKGSIIYSCGATAVRDDGQSLAVSRSVDQEGLRAALAIAQERFGSRIAVRGSDSFREQIALTAAAGKLDITFDDKAMELRRRDIVRMISAQARTEALRQRNASVAVANRNDAVGSGKSFQRNVGTTTGADAPAYSAMEALAGQHRAALFAAECVRDREQRRAATCGC